MSCRLTRQFFDGFHLYILNLFIRGHLIPSIFVTHLSAFSQKHLQNLVRRIVLRIVFLAQIMLLIFFARLFEPFKTRNFLKTGDFRSSRDRALSIELYTYVNKLICNLRISDFENPFLILKTMITCPNK